MTNKSFNNFDEFQKELNRRIEKVNGPVSFDKLFNKSFMTKYTQFTSFEELLNAGGFKVECEDDFESIPEDEFNQHIKQTTEFENWDEMKSKAGTEYVARELKL